MDASIVLPCLTDAALSSCDRSWPLVCAPLWLAVSGLGLGAACAIHLGVLAAVCSLLCGENSVQYFVFPGHAGTSPHRTGGVHFHGAWQIPDGHARGHRSGAVLERARSMVRTGHCSGLPVCGSAAAPLSWPHLISAFYWRGRRTRMNGPAPGFAADSKEQACNRHPC